MGRPKKASAHESSAMEAVDAVAQVRAYCEGKKLSAGTTKSACGLVAALLKVYPSCPTEEQVRADLKKAGKSSKTISNNLWAVRIWAASQTFAGFKYFVY